MRFRPWALAVALGPALLWIADARSQTPWIDAGQQAMIMHQGDLLEQQTAPNNGAAANSRASPKQNTLTASMGCSMARDREKLRPEYERRVQAQGRQAANAWLRQEAATLGRQAGARAKAGERC